MLGVWQLVLIFAIILVLFGAGKIPQIMKDLGSGIKAFKKGFDGEDGEIDIDVEAKKYNKQPKQKTQPYKKIVNIAKKRKRDVISVRKSSGKVDNTAQKKRIGTRKTKSGKKNNKN